MKKIFFIAALFAPFLTFAQNTCCSMAKNATTEFASLTNDVNFIAAHQSPTAYVHQSEVGKMVSTKLSDGSTVSAYYLAAPKSSDKVVFVFHEWWGLNDHIKKEAEKIYHDLGDANVYAIDLYEGKTTANREEAAKLMGELKDDRAKLIMNAWIAKVGKKAKIATIGWCLGGGMSMQATLESGKNAKACVIYYGMPEQNTERLKKLNAPVLMIWPSQDQWINKKVVDGFNMNMTAAGKSLEVHSYDADHAFANPSNPQFDKEKTEDAYRKSIQFLKDNLAK